MAPLLVQEIEDEALDPETLELTEVETTFRQLLLDVAEYIDNNPSKNGLDSQVKAPEDLANEKLVLRFTGGWVRDKLLGVDSHDIDVAINKMTGYQFGLRLKEYLEIPGNAEKYGLDGVATTDKQNQKVAKSDRSKTVGGLHKIEANPDKSKHLETVTTKILGLDVDLVNLRKETYTEESRNPQMEFGTPEEDALRRDATVNAMFYNIGTERIEDFTGRGFDDMRDRIIRTPLEAYQTFKDDPLRVLRLIRFASRLNYKIELTALQAMRNPEIQQTLRQIITRERIGVEIEKSLKGPDPREALRLIFELDLYKTVFSDPTVDAAEHYEPDTTSWKSFIDFLQESLDADGPIVQILAPGKDEHYLAWQLAALIPYRDAPQAEPLEQGRRAPPPVASSVAREGVKATNKVCDVVTASVRNQGDIAALIDKHHRRKRRPEKNVEGEDASARDVLGMAIRRWGPTWRSQVMYSMLVEVADDSEASANIARKYTSFIQELSDMNLLEACNFKPLMDGKALAKALGIAPGPWMKDALEVVMAYQLRNPDTANTEDAVTEVSKHQETASVTNGGELTSALIHHFLALTIRPLFIKAKPSSLTDTGRKNTTTVLPKKLTTESMDESITKPWKNDKERYALDLLRWCVAALDEKTTEAEWHLIVPPLLTLVDDWDVKYKRLGAELVTILLEATPPALLQKTGLGEVFEDALMPCLVYLPTITPENESIPLLDAVYPALLVLAKVRYPKSQSLATAAATKRSVDQSRPRIKFLDTIIRKGIIYGYTHCSNYPRIVSALFFHAIPVLNALGVNSVKHLKFILPALTETLAHPLADASSKSLINATKALQAVILNGWPRMAVHRGEVLKGLAFCWLNLGVLEDGDIEELRRLMKETVQILRAAVAAEVDLEADLDLLVGAEPRLSGLIKT